MSNKNNIDDLFRRSESRLTRRPSSRAWDRLESRLDNHNMKGANQPNPWMRYGGMVAAVLVLALAASTLTMFTNQNNEKQYAMLGSELVDISSYKNNSFSKYVDYQKEYLKFDKVFAEGDIEKNFIKKRNETVRTEDKLLAEVKKILPKQKKIRSTEKEEINQEVKSNHEKNTLPAPAPTTESIIKEESLMNVIPSDNVVFDLEDVPENRTTDSNEELTIASPKDETEESLDGTTVSTSIPAAPSATNVESTFSSPSGSNPSPSSIFDTNTSYELDAEEDAFMGITSEADDKNKTNDPLVQFQWLLGKWKEKGRKGSESIEEWKQIDDYTIQSTGLLKVNGVTLFSDEMTLRRKGENLVLETQINNFPQTTSFNFREWSNNTAVFENGNDRVLIQQNSNNKYTITMEGISSFDLNYLQQRNQIQSNQASREMKRK